MREISPEQIDCPRLSEITGLLADFGELDLWKGENISNPLFVYQRVEMQGPIACGRGKLQTKGTC